MKYGMTSYITRRTYETDREQTEQIMCDEIKHRALRLGYQIGKTQCRWDEAGEFGEPDPHLMLLRTTVEVTE
jgi:hypothetical protein